MRATSFALSTARLTRRAMTDDVLPGCAEALSALGLSDRELLSFQIEMARQGRNWQLALIRAFDSGVPDYRLLTIWAEGTRE